MSDEPNRDADGREPESDGPPAQTPRRQPGPADAESAAAAEGDAGTPPERPAADARPGQPAEGTAPTSAAPEPEARGEQPGSPDEEPEAPVGTPGAQRAEPGAAGGKPGAADGIPGTADEEPSRPVGEAGRTDEKSQHDREVASAHREQVRHVD
ncbi:hypothetical protein ABZ686_23600, partial [Streptomyces sp. NPDC006992]